MRRVGLMIALMTERAQALSEAVRAGPPPLGPGAPDRDRLLAFMDAMIGVVSRNKSLLAELARSGALGPLPTERSQSVYGFWHGHVSDLIASLRPDADADMIAHVLLGALHSEPVLAQLAAEGPDRLAAVMRSLILVACP